MPLVPQENFQFCGPTNLAASPVIDAERAINLYPERQLGSAKTQMALIGRPGFKKFSTTLPGGSGHGLWAGNSRLFAAIGTHVYEVTNTGTTLTDYGAGISTGPIQMRMIANGTQLMICDWLAGKIFNINPAGPSLDLVFHGVALEYLDGFYISIATGASLATGNPNQINVSQNGDGTVWPALAFAIRTGSADLTIQLAVLNSLLFIFGQKTIEVWYNAGSPIFPFARVNGGTINLGCLSAQSVVKFANTIVWLGADETGYGQVYMLQGMNPVKVSTPAIEGMIAIHQPNGLSIANAYAEQQSGHTCYVLELATTPFAIDLVLVYDLTTGLWHERSFDAGIIPMGLVSLPVNFLALATDIPNFVINKNNGAIYLQSITYPNDDGANIIYTRTAPHVGSQNHWFKYPRFELDGDFGTAQPILDYSNDGGRNFLGYNYPLIQAQDQGAPSTFKRFYANQLGRSRDRVFKATITDNANLIRIANAYLTAEALG